MSQQIAVGECSTEEDLGIEWVFASGYDPAGKTLEVAVRERSSASIKATLTVGSGLTIVGAAVKARVSKATMSAWARTEYTADLVDKTGGAPKRLVPTRIIFDEPGKLVGGVSGNSFKVVQAENRFVVTATTGESGPVGPPGPEGPVGPDAEARADIAAMQRRVPVTRSLMGVTPLIIVSGRVVGWLAGDGVKFLGLDERLKAYAEPRRSPRASDLPIMTDGRSLHRWRGAIAKLKAGVTAVKPRVVLTGDSWMELNPLPAALRDRIALDYTMAGWGWWYAIPGSRFSNPGAGYVRSANWAFVDASTGTALTYGTGPDGNLATTTLDTETLTLNNLVTTGIKIYTREWGGTWRYRVDGGAWTTVTETNTDGRLKITTISGLADASHVIDIDTTGNTGRVAFAGYMIAGADTGVEVLRMGNGASRGIHLTAWSPFIADIGADIAPDLVIVSLGTNDYRYSDGVAAYIQGLRDLRDGWRAAVPSIGFVFMAPPLSGGTVVTPQSQFRDALYEFCLTEGHEFFNGTDDWPAYSVSNAQGLWDDSLHPNAAGATAMVNRLYRNMLGL